MPCRVDPTPQEIEASRKQREDNAVKARRVTKAESEVQRLETQINWLSVQLDYTRDLVYRIWNTKPDEWGIVPAELSREVTETLVIQEKHRQADLNRLITALGKNPTKKNKILLKKVLEADPSKPLEPQLGFDPDSI